MTIELPNGRKIGRGEPCFVVAEIGQNHQGDAYTALRLIKAAHEAGVDAVKFCKRDIPSDLTREAHKQPYDNPHSFGATYGEHREVLELSIEEYAQLKKRTTYNEWPEVFFATVCDITSVNQIEEHINPPMYKIASRDIDNLPLIDYVATCHKPVILSSGMGSRDDVLRALEAVRRHHDQMIVLYCVSEYPTPIGHIDLRQIERMESIYDCPIGISDHSPGIVVAQTAAVMGAVMVEKHLTLARAMKGTDHAASLEPDGMARLVRNIRIGEQLQCPKAEKETIERELATAETRRKLGRSLVARGTIEPGEMITEGMLTLKSPGTGLRWGERWAVIGHKAVRYILPGALIVESDVLAKSRMFWPRARWR